MTAAPLSQSVLPQPTSDEQTPAVIFPPSVLESDEPPLESSLHLQQILLLLACLDWYWSDRSDYFAAGNLTVFYSPHQRKSEDFRGPDSSLSSGQSSVRAKVGSCGKSMGNIPTSLLNCSPTPPQR